MRSLRHSSSTERWQTKRKATLSMSDMRIPFSISKANKIPQGTNMEALHSWETNPEWDRKAIQQKSCLGEETTWRSWSDSGWSHAATNHHRPGYHVLGATLRCLCLSFVGHQTKHWVEWSGKWTGCSLFLRQKDSWRARVEVHGSCRWRETRAGKRIFRYSRTDLPLSSDQDGVEISYKKTKDWNGERVVVFGARPHQNEWKKFHSSSRSLWKEVGLFSSREDISWGDESMALHAQECSECFFLIETKLTMAFHLWALSKPQYSQYHQYDWRLFCVCQKESGGAPRTEERSEF